MKCCLKKKMKFRCLCLELDSKTEKMIIPPKKIRNMLNSSSMLHVCCWNKNQAGKPEAGFEIHWFTGIKEVQLFCFMPEGFPWGLTGFGGALPIAFSMVAISEVFLWLLLTF